MAHLIDMTNGRANMAYVGEKPWHGLGQELTPGADLDQWRIEAGLAWEAQRNGLYYRDATKTVRKSEKDILYRSDTGDELGIVSPSYKIVQPAEVIEFFRDLTRDHGFMMETAGSLDGGRKAWALARTGQSFRLMGTDEVKAYVLLATSFDGTLATRAQFTSVRVVCNNTLQISLANKSGLAISHSTDFHADRVKFELGLLDSSFGRFEDQAVELSKRRVSRKEAMAFILSIMAPETKGEVEALDDLPTRRINVINGIFGNFERGIGADLVAANGTAWGLVNAITQYVDHEQGNNVNNRFRSAQFGTGADLKSNAFAAALQLVA